MIGQLLVISRLEGGAGAALAQTALQPLVESVAAGVGPALARGGVRLEISVAEGLSFQLDAELVRRLLENLLMNASRHVGSGDRIELRAERTGAGLLLAVRNSGPPLPAALRERLFEKYQAGGERQGAGLGLYLCRLVAEAHRGALALRERAGWNVSFEAELPG
jgi:signal transduction histidine kinase